MLYRNNLIYIPNNDHLGECNPDWESELITNQTLSLAFLFNLSQPITHSAIIMKGVLA